MPSEVRDHREPGHYWADNEIIDIFLPRIGPYGLAVYTYLSRFANHATGECDPSVSEMVKALHISAPMIRKAIDCLVQERLIACTPRKTTTKGQPVNLSNLYTLLNVKKLVQEGGYATTLRTPYATTLPRGTQPETVGVRNHTTLLTKKDLKKDKKDTAAEETGSGGAMLLKELKLGLTKQQTADILQACPDFNRDDLARCQHHLGKGMKPGLLISKLSNGGVRELPPPPTDTATAKKANIARIEAFSRATDAARAAGLPDPDYRTFEVTPGEYRHA